QKRDAAEHALCRDTSVGQQLLDAVGKRLHLYRHPFASLWQVERIRHVVPQQRFKMQKCRFPTAFVHHLHLPACTLRMLRRATSEDGQNQSSSRDASVKARNASAGGASNQQPTTISKVPWSG